MTWKIRIWFSIAVLGSIANLAGVWFAARPAEPWHATVHALLAVASALWAQWLRTRRRAGESLA